MVKLRFVQGLKPLGDKIYLSNPYPQWPEFTILAGTVAIGHVKLSRDVLVTALMSYYRALEYPFAYYALMTPGADPKILRKKVADKQVKLYALDDILHKALWSKNHLAWFESDCSNFRVRENSIRKDTAKVIKNLFREELRCSEWVPLNY